MRSIGLILIAALFLSCAAQYRPEVPQFKTYDEAFIWIDCNIDYVADEWDEWQLPEETMDRMDGDCEDKAILALSIIADQFGEEGEMVLSANDSFTKGHAWIEFEDINFGEIPWFEEYARFTYDEAMLCASVH